MHSNFFHYFSIAFFLAINYCYTKLIFQKPILYSNSCNFYAICIKILHCKGQGVLMCITFLAMGRKASHRL